MLWRRVLRRLGTTRASVGRVYTIWEGLRRYPATLLLYALGIGAVEASRLEFLGRLLRTPILEEHRENKAAVQALPASVLFDGDVRVMRLLEGMENRRVPISDWMHDALRPSAARIVADDNRYTFVFDKLETLLALGYVHLEPEYGWAPIGAFCQRTENRDRIVQEIEASLSRKRDESEFVRCGIFGDTADVCTGRLAAFSTVLRGSRRWG